MSYQIDGVDRSILSHLQRDARTPFLEIARDLGVSGGTVHTRVNRMRQEGIIRGYRVVLDHERLGLGVVAFVGIKLVKASSCAALEERFKEFPEILEVHFTTGAYSLFIKVVVPTMQALHRLLADRLQGESDEIQSTETFVVLNTSLERDVSC